MKHALVKLDTLEGRTVCFTSDLFEGGVIWNKLPLGVYISNLYPKKDHFEEALNAFFGEVDRLHLLFRYSAPSLPIEVFLIKRGYHRYTDSPGTPFYTNTKTPTSCVDTPRSEEWLETTERILLQSGNEYVG